MNIMDYYGCEYYYVTHNLIENIKKNGLFRLKMK